MERNLANISNCAIKIKMSMTDNFAYRYQK